MPDSENSNRAPQLTGISLLKAPVSDMAVSLAWYEKVLGAERLVELDHLDAAGNPYAYMLHIAGLPLPVQLRLAPRTAARCSGFDPFAFEVETLADLEAWEKYLEEISEPNSGVLRGLVGWYLVFRDPDGLSLRIFTREHHDIDHTLIDSPWTAYPAETESES